MLCLNPYLYQGIEIRCGSCDSCLRQRRKTWTARLVLESLAWEESSFVTLTYNAKHCPPDGKLRVSDVMSYVKVLKSELGEIAYLNLRCTKLKFFAVGEYGERSLRPHYHLLLFGLSPNNSLIAASWRKGFVSAGTVSPQSAQYCAGYTVKKLTTQDKAYRTFMRCTLRPGIGYSAIPLLKSAHMTLEGQKYVAEHRDVMKMVRIGKSLYPIGRYLTMCLRKELSLPLVDPRRLDQMREEHSAFITDGELREARERLRETHARAIQGRACAHRSPVI